MVHFELFDRDAADGAVRVQPGPVVRVDDWGRLQFNGPVWEFLAVQVDRGPVALLFDAETRTAAVKVAGERLKDTPGALWALHTMRSTQWPRSVSARPFVKHYRIAVGVYPAGLLRGPGPRMVTFTVGPPHDSAG